MFEQRKKHQMEDITNQITVLIIYVYKIQIKTVTLSKPFRV